MPRTLGKGLPLREGDRLTTSDGAAAIIKLEDGTRMTLRPNSELVVQQYRFKAETPADNNMVLQLLRGGFRAVTGLISKSSPNAAKVQTSTSTIGIRGTDFDVRICGPECKAESSRVNEVARPNAVLASAKLVAAQGEIYAVDPAGVKRRMVDGASLYPGETVETGPATKLVLVFRDESRITLGSNTRFKVDSFIFDAKNPKEGMFLVSLLKGSLRALTGLVGKANNRNVGFTTATATIGIRGTGLDLDCGASDSCSFFTWLGTIEVTPAGQTALQTLQAGQGLFVGRTGIRPLSAPTLENLPRPDTIQVNTQQLFSGAGTPNTPDSPGAPNTADAPGSPPGGGEPPAAADEEGLYVFVRDGHIEVVSTNKFTAVKETLHLGRGETGFASNNGTTKRPPSTPLFIQADKVPMPNTANPLVLDVMRDLSNKPRLQCQ
jgi:hypothetical protein